MARRRTYIAFARRLRGQSAEGISGWSDSVLVLVPKPGNNHELLEGWRPICLVSTMFKWHEAFVWSSLAKTLRPLPSWILGFHRVSGHGCGWLHTAGSVSSG